MLTNAERLQRFGLTGLSATQGVQHHVVKINDIDHLRSVLDLGHDEAGRAAHFQALSTQHADAKDSLIHRAQAYVFGNEALSSDDRTALESAFPLTVNVSTSSAPSLTIDTPYDLSTPDGSPKVVLFSDVTIASGGYFFCSATPLQFTCATLTRTGPVTGQGDFNILGRTGAAIPAPGGQNAPGQAQSGAPGQCSSVGIAGSGGGNGYTGAAGKPGTTGGQGNSGVPSQSATITITGTISTPPNAPIVVFTQSGSGGAGQPGGPGQPGGQGGPGGDGATCDCTGNGGGSGGSGGAGGDGGAGGPGGNGTNASGNIVVNALQAQIANILQGGVTSSAPPGAGGAGGSPGAGGGGGAGGSGGKHNSGGAAGGSGGTGATGPTGPQGTVYGQPATVIIQPL